MNARRLDLIQKKNRQGLSSEEMAEFETLQNKFGDYVDALFPLPEPDFDKLERLEKRIGAPTSPDPS